MRINKLNDARIRNLVKPGLYGDGAGLWLQITRSGARSWVFRFMRNGRARAMGLGPLHTVSLAEARALALKARQDLLGGRDPIEARIRQREKDRVEAAKAITFKEAAESYLVAPRGWKNVKHASQWRATLETYAYPVLGALPVAVIDTPLVLKVLRPIWATKTETASRVRGRLEAILDSARVEGFRSGDNPARWRGHLDKLLPARSKVARVKHHPAMPYRDLPMFTAELRDRDCISARALEFVILTATRTGEAIGATWDEVDTSERIWRIPGERMKAGKPHSVPLTDRVLEILAGLPRVEGCPYLFPGARIGRAISNMAMLQLMREMRPGFVPHGLRSSFRDWTAEQTPHPAWIAEAALAHAIADKVEAAYRRGELIEKRRTLMGDWAAFCCAEVMKIIPACVGTETVVASHGGVEIH